MGIELHGDDDGVEVSQQDVEGDAAIDGPIPVHLVCDPGLKKRTQVGSREQQWSATECAPKPMVCTTDK